MEKNTRIQQALSSAVKQGVFPGAVLLVALDNEIKITEAAGWGILDPKKWPVSTGTIFDIASLTKPLATLLSLMVLGDQNKLDMKSQLGEVDKIFRQSPSSNTPIEFLLNHCSGLPDWRPYYKEIPVEAKDGKDRLRQAVLNQELEYNPGSREIYSDPGYILLGWLVEVISKTPLDIFSRKYIYDPLKLTRTGFNPESWQNFQEENFAATEDCQWRNRVILREVHDENAWIAGGVCGHAGLFSTAEEVFTLTRALPQVKNGLGELIYSRATAEKFLAIAQLIVNSEWSTGLMKPTPGASSSGKYFSADSVGHLGYSGCSFWIDPEAGLTVILLTNRVHPDRKNEKIKEFRPVIHNIVYEEIVKNDY